jgi:hypothetical protein
VHAPSLPASGRARILRVVPGPVARRTLLLRAGYGMAIAACGGLVALVRTHGYELPPGVTPVVLSAAEYEILGAIAARICAPDDRGASDAPSVAEVGVVAFADRYIAEMHPAMRRDLLRFFMYIEQLAPLRLGLASRFTRLSPGEQDRVLGSIEASDEGILRGGFDGLKSLVFMGYYRDARTWPIAGYGGPWLASDAPG